MADMKTSDHIAVELSVWADAAHTIPAEFQGAIAWLSSDQTVIMPKITDVDTGKVGFIEGVAPGKARMVWTGDADLGEGVENIMEESEEVTVSADPLRAGFMKVTLGPATPKTPAQV